MDPGSGDELYWEEQPVSDCSVLVYDGVIAQKKKKTKVQLED